MAKPSKKIMLQAYLEGEQVEAHFDGTHPHVQGPAVVRQSFASLGFGEGVPVPTLTDEGFRVSLRFEEGEAEVFVPWGAVFALSSGGYGYCLWAEDAPDDEEYAPLMAAAGGAVSDGRPPRPSWLRVL